METKTLTITLCYKYQPLVQLWPTVVAVLVQWGNISYILSAFTFCYTYKNNKVVLVMRLCCRNVFMCHAITFMFTNTKIKIWHYIYDVIFRYLVSSNLIHFSQILFSLYRQPWLINTTFLILLIRLALFSLQ